LASSDGLNTPFSVIIPVIRFDGVTSNAGFQHLIPVNIPKHVVFNAMYLDMQSVGKMKNEYTDLVKTIKGKRPFGRPTIVT
jgi:hypothetical protein